MCWSAPQWLARGRRFSPWHHYECEIVAASPPLHLTAAEMNEVLCGFQLRENHRAPPEMVLSKSKSPSGGLNLRCTVIAAPPVRRFRSFSHICAIIIASFNATPVFIPQAPPPSAVASPSNSGMTPQTCLCLRSVFRRPTREIGTTNLPRHHRQARAAAVAVIIPPSRVPGSPHAVATRSKTRATVCVRRWVHTTIN